LERPAPSAAALRPAATPRVSVPEGFVAFGFGRRRFGT
jgi:hypothetical protein